MELTGYRDRFPILRETTYLINHSLGAMPAAAADRAAEYTRTWATRGIRAWGEGWWTMPLTVGDQMGRIIGAPAGSVVMHQNVTIAESIVLSCFRLEPPRNRIVYEAANFPSVRYLYQAHADRGAEIVVVPEGESLVDAIDERTLLVPVQHVLFKTGEIHEEIGVERIRESSLRLTELLIGLADARGFEVRSPREPERRGGTVTVYVPDFEAVHKELGERRILCDFRPDAGIRLGPHYFTTDDELRFAVDQIAEILETGAHERHLGAAARF